MGVSGSGKSTVGAALAAGLGMDFADGDDFHSDANRRKMADGHPLTDDDRWPWLTRIGAHFRAEMFEGRQTVVACSALKRVYRDRIRAGGASIFFVELTGTEELLAERMRSRQGHFMKADMLASQLAILEPLEPDEFGVSINIAEAVTTMVARTRQGFDKATRHPFR